MALRRLTYIDSTEGNPREVTPATDEFTIGKASFTGLSGIAIDGGATRAVNFANPVADQDLATKFYVLAVANGLDPKASVRLATDAPLAAVTAAGSMVGKTLTATGNGALTVDGTLAADGNRVLVKDQVAGEDNGIYDVTDKGSVSTPFILTRSLDADDTTSTPKEVTSGMTTYVEAGTVNIGKGFVLVTQNPIILDTNALVFSQNSSATAYTFDQGLLLSGSSVKIELDTSAAAQTAGAGGGSSGLEFDANTNAGKVRAAVNATGGIQRSATGLSLLLDGTSLTTGAAGVKVDHSRAQQDTYTSNAAIAAADPVRYSVNDRVIKADATSAGTAADCKVVAVAKTGAGGSGIDFQAVSSGPLTGVLVGATVNTTYFLASGGGLTTTRPSGGAAIVRIGWAINATDLFVSIEDCGRSAA